MIGRRVIVVGGGLAGITAALDCARAGATVTLLESRGRLGGAAYSFTREGIHADNGQHVFLRCCVAYRRLLEQLEAADSVSLQPRLQIAVLAPGGRRAWLRSSELPAPLHLAGALARCRFLDVRARVGVARAMRSLRSIDPDDAATDACSFGDWLREHGQGAEASEAVWSLIARPTLNLDPAAASLAQAAQVFQRGLLEDSSAGGIGYARVPLSDIHDRAARRALAHAGVTVRLRNGATTIVPTGRGFRVEINAAPTLESEAVILAVPPDWAGRLLPAAAGVDGRIFARLGRSPIVNVHVVYDRRVLDVPFAAGIRTPVQWVFDRTESAGLNVGQYLVVSLSAADTEKTATVDDLLATYLTALADLLPAVRDAFVETFFVTREHAATFRASPGARVAACFSDQPAGPRPRRGVDRHGLAGDHGGRGEKWARCRSGGPDRRAESPAVGYAGLGWCTPDSGTPAGRGKSVSATASPDRSTSGNIVVLAPLSVEARAVRSAAPWAHVHQIGMGPRRAARSAELTGGAGGRAVLIAGFCRALDPDIEPGDIVPASELLGPTGTTACDDPAIVAGVLRRGGLRVRVAPIASSQRLALGERRRILHRTGTAAVDRESAWLAPTPRARPLVTLRVVLDTHRHALYRSLRTFTGAATAYRTLRRACALVEGWAQALGPREVVLASPRASCADVSRAVEVVERALEYRGAPIYVRKQIVHNAHIVASLEERGAVFVDDVDEVPPGATVIFSAHGVSPEVRARASERGLDVIDATCPLVSKVHAEARRFAASDLDIVLIGHEGHEEVDGTFGEAPERTRVIARPDEVAALEVKDPQRVAYLTQTTLAVDDTASVVEALRARFPAAVGPPSNDICYATQNRQDAVRALAAECDLMLVVGSGNSSNSRRLVEVAQRAGCSSLLVERASDIPPEALVGAARRPHRRRLRSRGPARGRHSSARRPGRRNRQRAQRGDRGCPLQAAARDQAPRVEPTPIGLRQSARIAANVIER